MTTGPHSTNAEHFRHSTNAPHFRRTVLYLDHTAKWSGGEIALLRTLEALDRTRVNPVVLLADKGPFADKLHDAGIEVHVIPLSEELRETRKDTLRGAGLVGKAFGAGSQMWSYARQVAAFARQRGAVIIHCNSLKSDIYGALAGKMARLPVLWHVRDHIDPSYLPAPAVAGFRLMARTLPDFIVTNSDSTTEKLLGRADGGARRRRVRAIHDGLSPHELTTPQPEPSTTWKHDPPRVGMVGRIVAWKGQHVFLEAAQKVTQSGIEARYVVVGAPLFGEEAFEQQLHKQAQSIGGRVQFTGFRRDVADLVRDFDILVHASTSPEPFGQVVIEGMAEGVAVIASDGGGVQEILARDETDGGLRSPMGDSDALALALGALLQDPARANRMARAGWAHIRENFTAAHTARRLEAVYDEMMVGRREPAPTVGVGATAKEGG